jgi:hypothetical protein
MGSDWARIGQMREQDPGATPAPVGSGDDGARHRSDGAIAQLPIKASENERRRILAELADLLRTHPATAGRHSIEVPYITHTFHYGV